MSDADAAGGRAHAQEKYFNPNMVVCFAEIAYERIVEELTKPEYLKAVTGFQKLDFHHRYGVAFSNPNLRNKLVVNGLDIDLIHFSFVHHAKRNDLTRVLVSKLPLGISNDEIRYELGYYGDILSVQQVTRVMCGKKLDTGDRVVTFKKIHKDIPTYVPVRGWKAYIMYKGQPKTCRSCGKVGHFAKDCSSKRKSNENFSEDQNISGKKRKSEEKSTANQDIPVNMEITEPSVIPTHEQVIKELMDTLEETESDPVVQSKMNESQGVTDSPEDIRVKKDSPDIEGNGPYPVGLDQDKMSGIIDDTDPTKVKKNSLDIDESRNPQSSMDSSSVAEGSAALLKQTTERNLTDEDHKHDTSVFNKSVSSHASGVTEKEKEEKFLRW